MLQRLTITDVTRMNVPYVCIAGVDEDGESWRPVFSMGRIHEEWLLEGSQAVIHPFAVVEFDFREQDPDPPHTEDWIINPNIKRKVAQLDQESRKRLLREICDPSVEGIFGAEIHNSPGYYIRQGEGLRSLGTIEAEILDFRHTCYDGRWDYRLSFVDSIGEAYRLKVTDLGLRYYIDHLREERAIDPGRISQRMTRTFRQRTAFLRIGLTRPTWAKYPGCCFLQVNGLYTFPDYLAGRCFANYRLSQS